MLRWRIERPDLNEAGIAVIISIKKHLKKKMSLRITTGRQQGY
jgi:hypothetical protein